LFAFEAGVRGQREFFDEGAGNCMARVFVKHQPGEDALRLSVMTVEGCVFMVRNQLKFSLDIFQLTTSAALCSGNSLFGPGGVYRRKKCFAT
jgi:hypothetical protein